MVTETLSWEKVTGEDDTTSGMPFGEAFSVAEEADDAVWILTSTFIIFTMQSGFGLLESGSVTSKNEVNIMVKNAVDVIFGGLTYWMFGYAFSFGTDPNLENAFCGWGNFFLIANQTDFGSIYAKFFFQASFATTATTIVSGSMAERTKLEAYIMFSLLNTIIYCFPAHWLWGRYGWLNKLGAIDVAGAGPVHLVGGCTGLTATLLLKPRHRRYQNRAHFIMASPINAVLGMFMLWWGWLGFNTGSTFGISGKKWILASRSAVATVNASVAGGIVGFLLSYVTKGRKFDIHYMINGILGSLVGITGMCVFAEPWEALIIGLVGAFIVLGAVEMMDKLKIDDPVGCVGVHGFGAVWSLIAVGLFTKTDDLKHKIGYEGTSAGLFYGGGFHLLGMQALAIVSILVWTLLTSFSFLKFIDLTVGLRMPLKEEILGADIVEHDVGQICYDKRNAVVIGYYDENGREQAFALHDVDHLECILRKRRCSKQSVKEFINNTKEDDASKENGKIRVPLSHEEGQISPNARNSTQQRHGESFYPSTRQKKSRERPGSKWRRAFSKYVTITRRQRALKVKQANKRQSNNQNGRVYHICGQVKFKSQQHGPESLASTSTQYNDSDSMCKESLKNYNNEQSTFDIDNLSFSVDEKENAKLSHGQSVDYAGLTNDYEMYMQTVQVKIQDKKQSDGFTTYL